MIRIFLLFIRDQYYKKIKNFYSKNFYEKKLLNYINYNKGFFIEVGAFDGISQSNTYFFEKKLNWRGILIEPNPKYFKKLKINRSNRNMFYNNALVEKTSRVKIKMLSLGKMTIKINKKNKNFKSHLDLAKSNLHKNYDANPFFSKAIRLQDILVETNAPKHIDFFSLDVEGSELSVLKGIDHNFYKFKFILIEIREFKKVNKFLNKKNYKLIDSFGGRDFLYKFNGFSLKQ